MKVKQVLDELKEMETNAVNLNTSKGIPVEREAFHFTVNLVICHILDMWVFSIINLWIQVYSEW